MAAELGGLLQDLQDEVANLRGVVEVVALDTPTPADGWDVRDCVAHLAGTDVEAIRALRDPDAFLVGLTTIAADVEGFLTGQLLERRDLSRAELLASWQSGVEALLDALDQPAREPVPWYGPPMSVRSFATARLMEYWAHGQDVADAAGVEREPTDRLRHICHLGWRTRGFSYVNRGLPAPDASVALHLTGPNGATWDYGDGEQSVTGPALDFCLLVTQRRHRSELRLVAVGPDADQWLDIAQCFAGPPGPGRLAEPGCP